MTPIQIHVLLDIHLHDNPNDNDGRGWPEVVDQALTDLEEDGLIVPHDTNWKVTPKGECLIEVMKSLPMPVQSWNMPS